MRKLICVTALAVALFYTASAFAAREVTYKSVQCGVMYKDDGSGYKVVSHVAPKFGWVSSSTRLDVGDVIQSVGGVNCTGSGMALDALISNAKTTGNRWMKVVDTNSGNTVTILF